MSAVTTFGAGYSPTAPTEKMLVVRKSNYNPVGGMPIIVYCHSANGTAAEPLQYVTPLHANGMTMDRLMRELAESGYMVIAPDLGLKLWGNDTQLARLTEAITYAQANGGRAGAVQLIGFSMGGGVAQAYAYNNPASVKSLCVFAPVTSLQDFVTNNRAGQASSVNAAYGGAYNDATHGLTHSPEKFASSSAGPHVDMWYSVEDTTCVIAKANATITAYGSRCTPHLITGEHGSLEQFDGILISDVLKALDTYK